RTREYKGMRCGSIKCPPTKKAEQKADPPPFRRTFQLASLLSCRPRLSYVERTVRRDAAARTGQRHAGYRDRLPVCIESGRSFRCSKSPPPGETDPPDERRKGLPP